MPKLKKNIAIDLFCGAGGLTNGLEQAGICVAHGVDIDPHCEYPFETNNKAKFRLKDIREYSANELNDAWKGADTRILVGCAPCQPFSTYTQGPRGNYRQRWVLLRRFSELVEETKPDIVSMENVTPLKETEMFRRFLNRLNKHGYFVEHNTVDCREYGAPQMRKRLVLLASRLGNIGLLKPKSTDQKHWSTVRQAISHLPAITAGEVAKTDKLHRSANLSDLNLRRIQASSPGGTWRDWPRTLVAECHKKDSGRTYSSVYGRMEWDKPSPTITSQSFGFGNGRFGHPEQDRALSLREAALLQTFPRSYKFFPDDASFTGFTNIGRLIGNAVPPLLGRVIGESIHEHLKGLDKNGTQRNY